MVLVHGQQCLGCTIHRPCISHRKRESRTELFHLRMAWLTTAELSQAGCSSMCAFFQGTPDCISTVSVMQGYAGNSWQVFCSARGHDTGSWDWGHNAVGSAALVDGVCLVRAAGPSALQCGLPDCPGLCAEGFSGPRLAPQAFKLKSFHDLYLLSRGAALGFLYQFFKFWENRYQETSYPKPHPSAGMERQTHSYVTPHVCLKKAPQKTNPFAPSLPR